MGPLGRWGPAIGFLNFRVSWPHAETYELPLDTQMHSDLPPDFVPG
jgi:hypothetical protein